MSIGTFKIRGIESGSFRSVIEKEIEVDYTGQPVTYSNLKTATENRYKMTFTGTEISGSGALDGHILYEIVPIELLEDDLIPTDDTVDYILFSKEINISLE